MLLENGAAMGGEEMSGLLMYRIGSSLVAVKNLLRRRGGGGEGGEGSIYSLVCVRARSTTMASISRVTFANFFQVSQNQSSLSGQERLSPDLESRPPPPTTVRGAAQHTPTMVLEATILCIDNSEYVRNSDYLPTRLQVRTRTRRSSDPFSFCVQRHRRARCEQRLGVSPAFAVRHDALPATRGSRGAPF